MKYNVGDIVPHEMIQDATEWVNSVDGGYYLEDFSPDENGNMKLVVRKLPVLTSEQVAEMALKSAKEDRAEAVSKIVVVVDGMAFDGDEVSQSRMARSAVAMNDAETITWVLHNNVIAQVTKSQLLRALRLSGEEQTRLWTAPYVNTVKSIF